MGFIFSETPFTYRQTKFYTTYTNADIASNERFYAKAGKSGIKRNIDLRITQLEEQTRKHLHQIWCQINCH